MIVKRFEIPAAGSRRYDHLGVTMCELMALSFARPMAAKFAIGPFSDRGTENPHGWGLGWYPDRSLSLVKEPLRWQDSPHSAFLHTYPGLSSGIYLAHVRHKTKGGEPTHADTHPFAREFLGRDYCFAHNGTLEGVFESLHLGRFHPVGATDSEFFFCHLLGELERSGSGLSTPESWQWLHANLASANKMGQLNCLLSDGERLFVYHDAAGYKGLHRCRLPDATQSFVDVDVKIDLSRGGPNLGYAIATRPFTDSGWESFRAGELIVFEAGKVRFSSSS